MRRRAPHVDAIFGTRELRAARRSARGLAAAKFDARSPDFCDDRRRSRQHAALALGGTADAIADAFSHLRAFVTVQRGCSYYCTFCIVPHVRGRFDHRPLAAIVDEVRGRSRCRRARDDARRSNGQRLARPGGRTPTSAISAGRSRAAGPRAADVYLAASQGFHAKRCSTISLRSRSSIRASICRCNRQATRCCGE